MRPSGPVFPYQKVERALQQQSLAYQSADPFPHIVLNDFLEPEILRDIAREFEDTGKDWIPYVHLNERKMGRSEYAGFGPAMQAVVDDLGSPRFIRFLGELTGQDDLFLDPELSGGGFHATPRGGYLNIHTDFRAHPHRAEWERVVNLLIYLNEGWEERFGGSLELWDEDVRSCRTKIAPAFNRAVIFTCSEKSFHGYPDPLECPEGVIRKSIALYYYRARANPGRAHPTTYRARPGDPPFKRLLIAAENVLLSLYHRARMRLKFSDRVGGRIAKFLKFK